MVSLSDIPCVGEVVDRASKAVVDALFTGCRYLLCYKDGVDALTSEIWKLNIEVDRVSRDVAAALASGKIIKGHVLKWQEDAKNIQKSAIDFSERYNNRHSWRCIQCLPIPNPISRFQLGREAITSTKNVIEVTNTGKSLLRDEIADFPEVQNLPNPDSTFKEFQSRKDAYDKIWKVLGSDDSSVILGIHGMSGVGKTRMAEQIWEEAMKKRIFQNVIRVDVGSETHSETLDSLKLQKQIAEYLNCDFKSQENVVSRASQLNQSLAAGGKILIIFDDVWRNIRIDHIFGTSFGDSGTSKGSKILLTSRDIRVCLVNNCSHTVNITPLEDNEAWDLFSDTVGTETIDSLKDKSLAEEVCRKCAGLPVIIRAVGKALAFRTQNLWSNAHDRLTDGNIEDVPGISPEVYACLKLSFDNLEQKDARPCLLLCSLFPEDADIPIKTLTLLATGSELVHGGRTGISAMVDILKSSYLLLKGKDDEHFKVHDIIRDVAKSIAVKDYAIILEKCGSRLLHNSAQYATGKVLYLDVKDNEFHFPADLVCPDLRTLYMRSVAEPSLLWNKCSYIENLSDGMFENLRFLVLDNFCWLQQFSLQPLGRLRTLFLNHCALHNINGFPESLDTLCLWDCQIPEPLDLPSLPYLRKLEILENFGGVQFLLSTISSLSHLEELHLPQGFSIWGYPDAPILPSIMEFTGLTSLQISLGGYGSSTYTNIFCNLTEFNIYVGPGDYIGSGYCFPDILDCDKKLTRLIELSGNQLEGFHGLVERAEQVKLRRTNVKVSSIFDSNRKAFADLINLYIEECENVEYVARLLQDVIMHRDQPRISVSELTYFSKLKILEITKCYEMKYLFCNSVAKCLVQLQELHVSSCPSLEVIVMHQGTSHGDIINFSNLKSLKLHSMGSLKSFHGENKDTSDISDDDEHVQPLFNEMVAFPSLEVLEVQSLQYTSDLWGNCYHNKDNFSFCKLKSLYVGNCTEVKNVIPLAMLHKLQNLESLSIENCPSVISELGTNHSNTEVISLAALLTIDLRNLPCLTHTGFNSSWNCSGAVTLYPNIQILRMRHCPSMRNVFLPCIARDLVHLENLIIVSCEEITEIIVADEQEEFLRNVFPELSFLVLDRLPNLTSIWNYQSGEVQFPNLVKGFELCQLSILDLSRLPKLERLFHGANYECHMPALKRVDINECEILSTLFTCSVFSKLQCLHTLDVSNCCMLKGIVEDAKGDQTCSTSDNIITLSQLSLVTLKELPNLQSFIHGFSYDFHVPALEVVEVRNCGLSTLFTWSVLKDLRQLRRLHISSCEFLEHIVVDDETLNIDDKSTTLFGLESVTFVHLPILQSFLCGANYVCYMPALLEVVIKDCGLSTLFTSSAFESLRQLRKLEVLNCRLLKGIVEDTRGEENSDTNHIITLDRLLSGCLQDLPNLRSFMPTGANAYEVKIPNLLHFELVGCGKINLKTIEFSRDDFTCTPRSLDISCDNEIRLPYEWQLQSLNLERLTLTRCWWHELESPCFQRLKVLKIYNSGCSALFTFSGLESLQQLQQLQISNCALLEDIVEDVRGDETSSVSKKTVTLSQLKSIVLKELPKLKSFLHNANYECHLPGLEKVEVENCGLSALFPCSVFRHIEYLESLQVSNCTLLKGIIEDARADETSTMNDKIITLFRLSSVVLNDLPSLESFIEGENFECHLPALMELRVDNCGLLTLFPCSSFGNLRRLRKLEVSNCRLLEGIVEDARGEENSGTSNMIITLFNLSSVILKDLPILKSFSHTVSYAFNMPKLDQFWMTGCPQIESFTSLKTSTKLVSVFTEWHNGERVPDLSEYITENRKRESKKGDSARETGYDIQEPKTESVGGKDEESILSESVGESSSKNREREIEAGVKEEIQPDQEERVKEEQPEEES